MKKQKWVLAVAAIALVYSVFLLVGTNFSNARIAAEEEVKLEIEKESEITTQENDIDKKSNVLPQFSFTQTEIKSYVNEVFSLAFSSDQEIEETTLYLPKESSVVQETMPEGLTVEKGEKETEWLIHSTTPRTTFEVPVAVEKEGIYEASIGGTQIILEIELMEEVALETSEKSIITENRTEEDAVELEVSKAVEVGLTQDVTTFEELRLAVANPEVSQIEVRNTLIRSGGSAATAIGSLNRELTINGNGYSILFGAENGSLNLATLAEGETATLRLLNVTLIKETPTTAIFNAVGTGEGWTVELEDIKDNPNSIASLALIPQGKVVFTGGKANKLVNSTGMTPFIQAKDFEVKGGAQVEIKRPNSWVIFSNTAVKNAKITVTENSSLLINTPIGTGGPMELRGANAEINVEDHSKVTINTIGNANVPTNTTNNTVAMTGSNPSLSVTQNSEMNVTTTSAKRGIYINGDNSNVSIIDSSLNVTGANGDAVAIYGLNSKFISTNSDIEITTVNGNGIYVNGKETSVSLNNSEVSVRGNSNSRIRLNGSESKLTTMSSRIQLESTAGVSLNAIGLGSQMVFSDSSEVTITNTLNGQNLVIDGNESLLDVQSESSLTLKSGEGTAVNLALNGENPTFRVTNSAFDMTASGTVAIATDTSNVAISLIGTNPTFDISDSIFKVSITANAKEAIRMHGDTSSINVDDSVLDLKGFMGNSISMIGNDNQISMKNQSKVDLTTTSGKNLLMTGDNEAFSVEGGSSVQTKSVSSDSISILGDKPKIKIIGEGSTLKSESNVSSESTLQATIFLGLRDVNTSTGAMVQVLDNAKMTVLSGDKSPAMAIRSLGGSFQILNQANVELKSGNTSVAYAGAGATLRFISTGSYNFLIDNSDFTIEKTGGTAPGVRMFGGNNHINVINGGKFKVINPGDGTAKDGGIDLGNQGIHYTGGGDNSFTIDGAGSEVKINTGSGPAIDMNTNSGIVNTLNGGYFEAYGRTNKATGGIFTGGVLEVNFENPLFMNFQNNRPGGGNIFTVSNGSNLKATNSDLAVWKKDSNLSGDPDLNFRNIDYSFTGVNFNTLASTSNSDYLNEEVFGTTGLTAYSRLSSNNARWTIADELRVPTNADRNIYGHISIPVGLSDSRSAWDDEAIVTVEVETPDGIKQEYTAKTVGDSIESVGISIYGEEPRGGLFEIELEAPLEAGSKVRISKVELSNGQLTPGFEHQILTDTVEVFPIVPPTPAKYSSSIITTDSAAIKGYSENKEAEVTATHNGDWLNTDAVVIDENGDFTIDLSSISLEEDDEIQIFLRGNEGLASAAGIVNPPETNNERGNINPATELHFHDTTFEAATILTVGDLGPVSPVDPLNPEIEVIPENKPEISDEQGLLSLDFVSQFNFETQGISVNNQTYYANSQRLLNEDGTVQENEERPNYVQISDRRDSSVRGGWQLAVTQMSQFSGDSNQELKGAELSLSNQQLASVQGGEEPRLLPLTSPLNLIPGNKQVLLIAQEDEGMGTWIYRFGDEDTARSSVSLYVPRGATPDATEYSTTLKWELSSVPRN